MVMVVSCSSLGPPGGKIWQAFSLVPRSFRTMVSSLPQAGHKTFISIRLGSIIHKHQAAPAKAWSQLSSPAVRLVSQTLAVLVSGGIKGAMPYSSSPASEGDGESSGEGDPHHYSGCPFLCWQRFRKGQKKNKQGTGATPL